MKHRLQHDHILKDKAGVMLYNTYCQQSPEKTNNVLDHLSVLSAFPTLCDSQAHVFSLSSPEKCPNMLFNQLVTTHIYFYCGCDHKWEFDGSKGGSFPVAGLAQVMFIYVVLGGIDETTYFVV